MVAVSWWQFHGGSFMAAASWQLSLSLGRIAALLTGMLRHLTGI
jgi:hypothetical protein